MLPSQQDNPKGLHNRYIVSKVDGTPIDPEAEYFVMRVDKNGKDKTHINACRQAVCFYASKIRNHLPELSKDLIDRYAYSI